VEGGDTYQVLFEGPVHQPRPRTGWFAGTQTDYLNGTYGINFNIDATGLYFMHIALQNDVGAFIPIKNSPFYPVMVLDEVSNEFTEALGAGVMHTKYRHLPTAIIAGDITEFTIYARDNYNLNYFLGGSIFELEIEENLWNERSAYTLAENNAFDSLNGRLPWSGGSSGVELLPAGGSGDELEWKPNENNDAVSVGAGTDWDSTYLANSTIIIFEGDSHRNL
jgi:hypothetical protein